MTEPFEGVAGHGPALEALRRTLAGRTVHTGYLFCGPGGVGKRLVAERFIRAFLCAADGPEPCGRCPSCAHQELRAHPDIELVEPKEDRKSISIDQIRELGAWLALAPAWGRRKGALVEPADALTPEAQNALLKTLEEPPPGRVIVLVTSRPGSLAPTVLSRCQRVFFGTLSDSEVGAVLRRQGWPEQAARQAAAAAEGSPGLALARDGRVWQEATEVAGSLLDALARRDPGAGFAAAERAREGRDAAQAALRVLLGWLRLEARRRLGAGGGAESPPPSLGALESAEIDRLLARALDVHRRLEANANPRLALASLALGATAGVRASRGLGGLSEVAAR